MPFRMTYINYFKEALSIAPYAPTSFDTIRRMLTLAELKPGETLYDLGCGDGRIVIIAAQEFKANAIGIELREDLVKKALEEIHKNNLEKRAKIIQGDLFSIDISDADVVTLYLTTSANEKVRPKLEKELKNGARVVSHDFEIPKWKPIKIEKFNFDTIYLYKKGENYI